MEERIEDIIDRIVSNLTDRAIYADLLACIVDELGPEIGVTGGRLWELRGSGYVLIQKHRGRKRIPLGFRIPQDYAPIRTLRREGCVYHDRGDQTLDRELEHQLGVENFVAVAIGIDAAHIASFDTNLDTEEGKVSELLEDQQRVLRRIARATAIALNNAYRHQQALRERDFAYRMLHHMMPDASPTFEGFDIHGQCIFSDELGGDYYNFIRLPNGNLNVVIADAKGHGLNAAATVSLLHNALLRSMVAAEAQMDNVVTLLNRKLMKRTAEDNFATMSYVELCSDGHFSYCNAGQTPPLLVSAETVHELTAGGPILGVLDSVPYATGRGKLVPGQILVQYTDGITEAANQHGELFSPERLIEVVQRSLEATAREIVVRVLDMATAFGNQVADDMTVVVVKPPC